MWTPAIFRWCPHGASVPPVMMVQLNVPHTAERMHLTEMSFAMTTSDIHNRTLATGLHKALIADASDVVSFYEQKIAEETSSAPEHIQEWRRGSFSWTYVRGVEYWTEHMLKDLRYEMARKKGTRNNSRTLADYKFVRCELTSTDKVAAKEWIEKHTKLMGAKLHDLMASDYKVSISFSSEHDTFTASATGKEGAVNEFCTLTARHKDWIVAAMTLLYKHEVMFDSGAWEGDEDAEDGWS